MNYARIEQSKAAVAAMLQRALAKKLAAAMERFANALSKEAN